MTQEEFGKLVWKHNDVLIDAKVALQVAMDDYNRAKKNFDEALKAVEMAMEETRTIYLMSFEIKNEE